MRVLSFSLDPKIVDRESVVAARSVQYGAVLDMCTVLVPSKTQTQTQLAPNVTVHSSGGASKLVQIFRLYKKAKVVIKDDAYDVITSQDTSFLGFCAFLIARKHHVGFEVQVHGFEKLGWLRKKIASFLFSRASVIRVTSARLENKLIDTFQIPKRRIHIVPIHVDVSSLYPSKEDEVSRKSRQNFHDAYGDRFNFLTVSRLVPVKNILLQLQAIEELCVEFPNIMLHIVGEGPEKERIESEIAKRNLEKYVLLHGVKQGPELGVFYSETDCFLLTSHSEGYGMVVIEAAHASLPVIMTNVGCANEVIIDGESGFVVEDDDLTTLVAKMKIMLTEENTRSSLGKKGKVATEKLLDFNLILEKYIETWKSVSERPL